MVGGSALLVTATLAWNVITLSLSIQAQRPPRCTRVATRNTVERNETEQAERFFR